ncbi:MAG: hypothetical protein ACI8S6_001375 [Myxococcota bacterium]
MPWPLYRRPMSSFQTKSWPLLSSLLLLSMPAWADDIESIERKLERRGPEAAWRACEKLIEEAPLPEELREPCARADLLLLSENGASPSTADLDAIAARWAGTAAAGEAHETAAQQTLAAAGQDQALLEDALARYPNTTIPPEITARLLALVEDTAAALRAFCENYPDAPQRQEAWARYLAARHAEAAAADTAEGYRAVLEEHPDHPEADALRLAWGEARFRELDDTTEALEAFLGAHASHPRAPEASRRLDELLLAQASRDDRAESWAALLARRPDHHAVTEIMAHLDDRRQREAVFAGADTMISLLQQSPDLPRADTIRAQVAAERVAVQADVPDASAVKLNTQGVTTLPLGSMTIVIETELPMSEVTVLIRREGQSEALTSESMPLPEGLRTGPVAVEVEASSGLSTITLPAGWCAPEGAELAVSMTVLGGRLSYPFTAPFSCEELEELWGLSAATFLGGKSWRLGGPAQPQSGSISTSSLGDKLFTAGVECMSYDDCYSEDGAYNRMRPAISSAFEPIEAARASLDYDLRRQGTLLMSDQQYVGPQSGDPSFSLLVTDARLAVVALHVNAYWASRFHPFVVESVARGDLTDAPIPYLTAIATHPIRDRVPSWHTMLALNIRGQAIAELIHRGEYAAVEPAWAGGSRSHLPPAQRVLAFADVGREDFAEIHEELLASALKSKRIHHKELLYVGRQAQHMIWVWTDDGWMLLEPEWSQDARYPEPPEQPVISAAEQARLSALVDESHVRTLHSRRQALSAEPPPELDVLRDDGVRVKIGPPGSAHSRWLIATEPAAAPTLEEAESACAALTLGGRTGWRVPPRDLRFFKMRSREEMMTLGFWQRDPITGEGWLQYSAYIGTNASQGWTGLGPRINSSGPQTRSGRVTELSVAPENRKVYCTRPLEESATYETWRADVEVAMIAAAQAVAPLP